MLTIQYIERCQHLILNSVCRTEQLYRYCSVRTAFRRWQDAVRDKQEMDLDTERRKIKMGDGMYISIEDALPVGPQKSYEDKRHVDLQGLSVETKTKLLQLRQYDASPAHRRRRRRWENLLLLQYDQRFLPERHLILGPNLASAHFIVHRGGSVKFVGSDEWIKPTIGDVKHDLPSTKKNMKLEAIDASNTFLIWEGFDNLVQLKHLRYLNVANCMYFDDWCLDRLHQFPNLEFLDLSNCQRISAKGLTALSKLRKLKFVRLEGLEHIADIGEVIINLEKANPNVQFVDIDFNFIFERTKRDRQLAEHPNVIEDARGNLFMKDNDDEMYIVKSSLKDPAIVDEFGLPLYISKVRKDPPELPPEQVEIVNRLSDGKLKHSLVGSPSGEWTVETERILTYEAYLKFKKGDEIHPNMLPECMKTEPIRESFKDKLIKYLPIGGERTVNLPPLVKRAIETGKNDVALMTRELKNMEPVLANIPIEFKAAKSVLLKNYSGDVSLQVKSDPPKPRPARFFAKYSRISGNHTK